MPSTTSSPESEPIDVEPRDSLCAELGYAFVDDALLDLALRHRSWCAENGSVPSNERLEFLGDAVLGLVITDHLFHSSPGLSEGVLAQRRSELVSATALAGVARGIGLGAALALGKGEESSGGREKASILADGMEAVLGAIYLDSGATAVTKVILSLLDDRITEVETGEVASDYKSRLQELAAHRFGELPRYALSEEGPEHEKQFRAVVRLGGEPWGDGAGRTKKEAEQGAARLAFEALSALIDDAAEHMDDADDTANDTGDERPAAVLADMADQSPGGDHA